MDNEPTNRRDPIALWQRFVFGAILPLAISYGVVAVYLHFLMAAQARSYATPGWGGTPADLLVPAIVFGFLSLIFVPSILLVVIRSVFLPWKHWWSALLGGFLAVSIGVAIGGIVLWLLDVLS